MGISVGVKFRHSGGDSLAAFFWCCMAGTMFGCMPDGTHCDAEGYPSAMPCHADLALDNQKSRQELWYKDSSQETFALNHLR